MEKENDEHLNSLQLDVTKCADLTRKNGLFVGDNININQQTVHFFQSDPHAVILNKLVFPSLHCSISNYTLKTNDPRTQVDGCQHGVDFEKVHTRYFVAKKICRL